MIRYLFLLLLLQFYLIAQSNANIAEKFNTVLIENYDFSQYPYLESRDDIGIFLILVLIKIRKK